MQSTTHSPTIEPTGQSLLFSDRALAFLVVAICPAVFWTGLLYFAGPTLGFSLSLTSLALVFTAISAFIGLVFSAIWANAS